MGLNPFIFNPSVFLSDTAVTAKLLTGYVSDAGTVAATDSILSAIEKLNGNIAAIGGSEVSSVNTVTPVMGNITLTTANIEDSTDKRYVTDAELVVIGNTSGTNTGDKPITTSTQNVPFASPVALVANTSKTLTSLSLVAGTYEITGNSFMFEDTTITMEQGVVGISTTANTFDDLSQCNAIAGTAVTGTLNNIGLSAPSRIYTFGSTTTVYMIVQANWASVNAVSACGNITAKKIA